MTAVDGRDDRPDVGDPGDARLIDEPLREAEAEGEAEGLIYRVDSRRSTQ